MPARWSKGSSAGYRCGIAWRDVPEVFGPWRTIWTWHRRMAGDGTWDTVLQRLHAEADAAGLVDWSVSVDSTIARAHRTPPTSPAPQGAGSNYTGLLAEPPDHAIGGWSTKVYHIVDGNGRPLVTLVGPGQAGDAPMFPHLMRHLAIRRAGRTRPDRLRGDKAYSLRAIRRHLRDRDVTAVIPESADQIGHRKRRGSRGGRPPAFDALDYRGRNVVERRFNLLKQWRGLATRYDKLTIVYRSADVLHAVITWTKALSYTT
ncbi:IS5 family transposase [Amycolatopsis sp. NPDC004378]